MHTHTDTHTVHMHKQAGIQNIQSGWAFVISFKDFPLSPLKKHSILTCKRDVKASVCVGVVSQKLQSGHMGTGCYGRRQGITREGTQDRRLGLTKTDKDFLMRPKVS